MSVETTIKTASEFAQHLVSRAQESTNTAITIGKLIEELEKIQKTNDTLEAKNLELTSLNEKQRLTIEEQETKESQMETKHGPPQHFLLWPNGIKLYEEQPEIATKLFFERQKLYEKINPEFNGSIITKQNRDQYIGLWVNSCHKNLTHKERNKEFLDLNSAGMLSWEELNRLNPYAPYEFMLKFDPTHAEDFNPDNIDTSN